MTRGADKQITFRIPLKLREEIHEYCQRRGVSLAQLTLDYYRALLAAESEQEAEQM